MRLHEDVLRFLTVRVEALDTEPSAILRKDEREGRPFGDRGDRPRRPRDDNEPKKGEAA
jgi:small subunit ribosomal protein S6